MGSPWNIQSQTCIRKTSKSKWRSCTSLYASHTSRNRLRRWREQEWRSMKHSGTPICRTFHEQAWVRVQVINSSRRRTLEFSFHLHWVRVYLYRLAMATGGSPNCHELTCKYHFSRQYRTRLRSNDLDVDSFCDLIWKSGPSLSRGTQIAPSRLL